MCKTFCRTSLPRKLAVCVILLAVSCTTPAEKVEKMRDKGDCEAVKMYLAELVREEETPDNLKAVLLGTETLLDDKAPLNTRPQVITSYLQATGTGTKDEILKSLNKHGVMIDAAEFSRRYWNGTPLGSMTSINGQFAIWKSESDFVAFEQALISAIKTQRREDILARSKTIPSFSAQKTEGPLTLIGSSSDHDTWLNLQQIAGELTPSTDSEAAIALTVVAKHKKEAYAVLKAINASHANFQEITWTAIRGAVEADDHAWALRLIKTLTDSGIHAVAIKKISQPLPLLEVAVKRSEEATLETTKLEQSLAELKANVSKGNNAWWSLEGQVMAQIGCKGGFCQYETTMNGRPGYRAVLRTVGQRYSSGGRFEARARLVGTTDVQAVDGFTKTWDLFEEVTEREIEETGELYGKIKTAEKLLDQARLDMARNNADVKAQWTAVAKLVD